MPAAVRPEDVAFNRVSVALARSQSLVASWLPPRPAEDPAALKTPEQLQKEESALFTPGSDILGVGAEPPKDILDGSFKRNQLSSNERLRQQILGKNAAKGRVTDQKSTITAHLPSKKLERPAKPARAQEDSDDEDGRAAMFKSKKKAAPAPAKEETLQGGESGSDGEVKGRAAPKKANPPATQMQEKSRKRPVSFLDELLEERSKKKIKKQKAQAEPQSKAAVEEPKIGSQEGKPEPTPAAKAKALKADEEGSDGSEDETNKATTKSAPAKVSIQHGESGDPAITAENALLDRSDKKKKKKKKKKKSKGESTQQP